MFKPYVHVERFGNEEVRDIELGNLYIFPKIDGTNSSVWMDDGIIKGGSRTRELSAEKDNAGFYNTYVTKDEKLIAFFQKYPNFRLYGEWLVPHTITGYREDAWRKFYILDVCNEYDEFLPYPVYKDILDEFNLTYLSPICISKNASYENFLKYCEGNTFLMQDGAGLGEGIVIKNYDYYNKYGRQVWAKVVRNEFKEANHKAFGVPELLGNKMNEQVIVDKFVTPTLVDKNYAKVALEKQGWTSKCIPELLNRVYYDLVKEEMWEATKVIKDGTVNFKTLRSLTFSKVKELRKDIF